MASVDCHVRKFLEKLVRGLVLRLLNIITSIFFREVLKRGSHQVPRTGAVIFVAAPHANQFVDPMVVMQTCPRFVRFLMAASSMRRGIPGFFGRLLGCIPVERPMDLARKAKGKITVDPHDPLKVIGAGTDFLCSVKPECTSLSVSVPPNVYCSVVERVESDSVLFLKKPLFHAAIPASDDGLGFGFVVLPVIDQTDVYNSVFKVLEDGECLGIFPEGGSHDRAEMLPLKAGVTVMALGAMARRPDLEVTIIPCGLNYFNPDKFRSRAMVEYGKPLRIDRKLVEMFKAGGESRREACGRLLDQIYYSLCSVTINVPDFETLQVVQATRRLYQPASRTLNSFELLEITRRFIKGYLAYRDEPRIQRLRDSILEYNKLLNHFQLYDHQVKNIQIGRLRAAILLGSRLAQLLVYGIFVLPGMILNLPAIAIIDYISKQKAVKAVASSTVKLRGRDVLATWKLMVGALLLPSLYVAYTLIISYEVLRFYPRPSLALLALYFCTSAFVILPWISYMSVRVAEAGYDKWASIRPLWYSLVSPHYGEVFRNIRLRLKLEIIRVVEEYGPRLYGQEFDQQRIVPSRRASLIDGHAFSVGSVGSAGDERILHEDVPGAREIAEIRQRAAESVAISRPSSPLPSLEDGVDTVIAPLRYMKAGVRAVFAGASHDSFVSEWSYVDPVEIDDIFFTSASASQPLSSASKKTK